MIKSHEWPIVLWALFMLLLIGGWIANVVKLVGMVDGGITAMLVIRIVGVFAPPVGGVLGYL